MTTVRKTALSAIRPLVLLAAVIATSVPIVLANAPPSAAAAAR
jgi:hypothetical protein